MNIPPTHNRNIVFHGLFITLIMVVLFVPLPWFSIRLTIASITVAIFLIALILAIREKK